MTFADELRAAATAERKHWTRSRFHNQREIHLAVANWLDHTASLVEGNSGSIEGIQSSSMALVTARAINDGAGVVTA